MDKNAVYVDLREEFGVTDRHLRNANVRLTLNNLMNSMEQHDEEVVKEKALSDYMESHEMPEIVRELMEDELDSLTKTVKSYRSMMEVERRHLESYVSDVSRHIKLMDEFTEVEMTKQGETVVIPVDEAIALIKKEMAEKEHESIHTWEDHSIKSHLYLNVIVTPYRILQAVK